MWKDIGNSFLANEMVFVPSNLLISLEHGIHYKTVAGFKGTICFHYIALKRHPSSNSACHVKAARVLISSETKLPMAVDTWKLLTQLSQFFFKKCISANFVYFILKRNLYLAFAILWISLKNLFQRNCILFLNIHIYIFVTRNEILSSGFQPKTPRYLFTQP